MIYYVKEGMKVNLTPKGLSELWFNVEEDGVEYIFIETWSKDINLLDGKIMSLKSGKKYIGTMHKDWFYHHGKNVNSEVFNLLTEYEVKSFQAILEDGRTIHISCLN